MRAVAQSWCTSYPRDRRRSRVDGESRTKTSPERVVDKWARRHEQLHVTSQKFGSVKLERRNIGSNSPSGKAQLLSVIWRTKPHVVLRTTSAYYVIMSTTYFVVLQTSHYAIVEKKGLRRATARSIESGASGE
jgi:hypothetical protein